MVKSFWEESKMSNQFDAEKVGHDISKLKLFIEEIERLGGKVPLLKKAVNRLEIAVYAGVDASNAAEEASKELRAVEKNLRSACNYDYVCMAEIDRKYFARAVNWTLSWENRKSAFSYFIRNTICRYMPDKIADRLDYCAGVKK